MVIATPSDHIAIDSLPDGYARIDADWRIVDVNDSATRLLDLPANARGSVLWDLIPDWIGGQAYFELHHAMSETKQIVFEDHWQARNLWLQFSVTPHGNDIGLFVREIGETKQLEQALRESDERFRSTFEMAAVGIAHIGLDGSWLHVNERLCSILGYSPDELLLRGSHSMTHPDDLAKELQGLRMLLAGRVNRYANEKRFIRKSGTPVWVESTVSMIDPGPGQPRYLLAFIDETTERRAAAENLRQQLVINRSITNSTTEGLFMLDTAGRVTFVNPAAEELIGWSSEEMLGTGLHTQLFYARPDGSPYPISDSPLTEVLSSGVPARNHEDYLIRKDGGFIPVICSAAPIVDPSGMIMGAVVAIHDESELKAAQTELKTLYDREHRIAETLQRSMLMMPPRDAFPQLMVDSLYAAASDEAQVGGDFSDAVEIEGGKVCLVVGDVAGKGLAAAARTAEIKYSLRTFLRESSEPSNAIQRLNDMFTASQASDDDTIVSLALAVVDPVSGIIRYASAGAEPALIVRADGNVESSVNGGLLLGACPSADYQTSQIHLGRGDTLVMVTDGITEARKGPDFLGTSGLTELAHQSRSLSTIHMASAIMEGARAFAGGRLQDDACIILARRNDP